MAPGAGLSPRLRSVMAAAVVGPMAVAFNVSAAGIIYQGPLTAYLDRAIALILIAAMAMGALSALLFSYRGTIAQPQNMIAVILSIPAAGIALAAGPGPVSEATFSTIAALVAVTALTTGAVTWLLGVWRLGFVARFIPFPVLAGFLAATGYMLVLGGLGMAVGRHVELRELGVLLEPGNPGRWLPWAVAAIAITALGRRYGPTVLPCGLLVAAAEYAVVIIILVVSALFGFLWGVAVGVLAAALFFIMAFARIDLVRLETTASRIRSRVERPEADEAWLAQRGGAARIYVLAGFVFFGTAHHLAARIEAVLKTAPRPRFVLIDFRQVRGIDVSAARSLVRLGESCRAQGVALVASGLNAGAARLVLGQAGGAGPRILPSLADALEEVEAALLADVPAASAPALLDRLRARHPGADLGRYLREVTVPPGTEVIGQGDASDFLLFLTSGMLRTELRRGTEGWW